jgi:hypothetical protein
VKYPGKLGGIFIVSQSGGNKMQLKSLFTKVIILVFLGVFASTAYAQPFAKIPQESGFSGFVNGGAGLWRVEDNMVKKIGFFQVSDDDIGSIDNKPKSETSGSPIFNYNVRYTFASTRTQIFLGSLLEDILRFDAVTLLGVRQELPDQSVIAVSYVFSPLVTEVYKDPYVEGKNRNGTDRNVNGVRLSYDDILGSDLSFQYDRNVNGVRLSYDDILGSDLSFQYTYRNIDIDSERSGRQAVQDGDITASEKDRLDRNGDRHDLDVLYRFVSESGGGKHVFLPRFRYSNFNLNYRYDVEKFAFAVNGYYGYADYDKRNPIYGKTREDDRYGFSLLGFYKRFLGVEGLALNGTVTINRSDSNIDFYKSEVDLFALSLFYTF